MDYVRLGKTGLKISRICLGCMTYGDSGRGRHEWTLPEADSRPIIRHAMEQGINFFDTANEYSGGHSEEILGRAIADFGNRDEVVIATKAYSPWRNAPNTGGLSRKALFHAVDNSLKRLNMDYIDLYQIHRWDDETPIEETMEALHDIVKAGKVRYIGASSMYAWQFMKALAVADTNGWTRFVSMQNHLNLLYREEEREMMPLCVDQNVAVIPWSPLARGRLTRDRGQETERSKSDLFGNILYDKTIDSDNQVIDALHALATQRGVPRAQLALAWIMQKQPVAAPIIGASKLSHIDDAVAALKVSLSTEEIKTLESPYLPHAPAGLSIAMPFRGKLTVRE